MCKYSDSCIGIRLYSIGESPLRVTLNLLGLGTNWYLSIMETIAGEVFIKISW